ncbi:zinc-ribbon and DUF3426 domain-containing protein [Moraxella equi]|nr:zinc-ribbon and DUF3426 domain-containing protein [Moraxella equi]OPH38596.1 hypothetical protein B5J93_05980 [Moraxella equi]
MSNQTKCPHCQTTYPMPAAKLGDLNARAKCGKCQQVFFLNANLVTVSTPQTTATAHQTSKPQSSPAPRVVPTQSHSNPTATQFEQDSSSITPKRVKRTKSTPTEDMIHDEMDGIEENKPKAVVDVSFSDDELDNFLKDNISFAPTVTKSTKDEMSDSEDEAWINNLLDDNSSITVNSQVTNSASPIIKDVDLNTIIPSAKPKQKKPVSIKKIQPNKPTAQQIATKKPIITQLFWLIGCLLMLGLLAVQYALFNIEKITKNPETANLANAVCNIISCNIPSADLGSLEINSVLQNQTDVVINITNKSSTEQLFPYLLVQLQDDNGRVVADFVADTKDYLSESQTTILANQSKRIMLSATSTLNASSVTVTPFYQSP